MPLRVLPLVSMEDRVVPPKQTRLLPRFHHVYPGSKVCAPNPQTNTNPEPPGAAASWPRRPEGPPPGRAGEASFARKQIAALFDITVDCGAWAGAAAAYCDLLAPASDGRARAASDDDDEGPLLDAVSAALMMAEDEFGELDGGSSSTAVPVAKKGLSEELRWEG